MSQNEVNSPGSSSSSKVRLRLKQPLISCSICAQGIHDPKVCPWIYSRCKYIPCNGIRQLLCSKAKETNEKMFLKCSIPTCQYFEWFDDAIDPVKCKMVKLPVENGCYACGESGHCFKNCPLQNQTCNKDHCKSKMEMKFCKNEHNKNIAYLTCTDCDGFKWVSDEVFIAAKNRIMHSSLQLNAICKELNNLKM